MSTIKLLGPLNLPRKIEDVVAYYNNILLEYHLAIQDLQQSLFVPLNVAPPKPREGMIRFADGTNWNPGSGEGIYAFYGSSWKKLG